MEQNLNEKEIRSLISLIDDDEVFETVFDKIVDMGDNAIGFIDEEIESTIDSVKVNRLQEAYNQITLNSCISEMTHWKNYNSANLFKGLSIISRLRYPHLDLSYINKEINRIKDSLWLELNDNYTALEKIRIYNQVFFDMYGFSGDTKDFFNPSNSFIIDVLKRRKGNPITLSSLYTIIAQSVGIPIYGINMPRHFITAYTENLLIHPFETVGRNNVLFYINPFGRGEIYSSKEVINFLNRIQIQVSDDILLPCNHVTTIKRSINNLILIYKNKGETNNEFRYQKLLESLGE
ncbi:MAG: transglutaminase family protein [Bacteroidales bacterium]|nr:transglutaminase family protein [Bacteroidales bacterium]